MKLDNYTVGKRYGKALFELAIEEQQTPSVYQELVSLRQLVQEIPDLGAILSDVRLSLADKRILMNQVVQPYSAMVQNFLEVVFRYNRMNALGLIIDEYERRYNETQGVVIGTVTSAVKLSAAQKKNLAQNVAKRLGYQTAELTEQVNPELLGGVVIEANHQVIDGSVKSRLDSLRKELRR
ncbi:MAG: F0F1 ATP synthase subunit delta [Enterococcus sp.]